VIKRNGSGPQQYVDDLLENLKVPLLLVWGQEVRYSLIFSFNLVFDIDITHAAPTLPSPHLPYFHSLTSSSSSSSSSAAAAAATAVPSHSLYLASAIVDHGDTILTCLRRTRGFDRCMQI